MRSGAATASAPRAGRPGERDEEQRCDRKLVDFHVLTLSPNSMTPLGIIPDTPCDRKGSGTM
jgi:hypothetical protein